MPLHKASQFLPIVAIFLLKTSSILRVTTDHKHVSGFAGGLIFNKS